jgi:mRNA-degrading endonuclease toxin of MazEF toxin-antitoxin module
VPCTTTIKGGRYEVPLRRVKWMPGSDEGVANVLGIEAVEHHRFEKRAGRYEATVIAAVRKRISWMLEI